MSRFMSYTASHPVHAHAVGVPHVSLFEGPAYFSLPVVELNTIQTIWVHTKRRPTYNMISRNRQAFNLHVVTRPLLGCTDVTVMRCA
jgi:hypothetical protein